MRITLYSLSREPVRNEYLDAGLGISGLIQESIRGRKRQDKTISTSHWFMFPNFQMTGSMDGD